MAVQVVTRKGQITIPAEIRRDLQLQEGALVNVVRDGANIRVEPVGDVVARTAGALRHYARSSDESVSQIREATEQAIADDVVARMNH